MSPTSTRCARLKWSGSGLALLILLVNSATFAQGTLAFKFSGYVEYLSGAESDFAEGDRFEGAFAFDPAAAGVPNTPRDSTLTELYPAAVSSWEVQVPSRGYTFHGTSGEIAVGNDQPGWYNCDRYIVTMWAPPDVPATPSGRRLRFFQIDLVALGTDRGAALLNSVAIPMNPPPLNEVSPPNRSGRFVFTDGAQPQIRLTTLEVPEPSVLLLLVPALAVLSGPLQMGSRRWMRRMSPNENRGT